MSIFYFLRSRRHKNSRFWYNLSNLATYCLPRFLFRLSLNGRLSLIEKYNADEIWERVNYYNKLSNSYDCKIPKKLIHADGVDFSSNGGNAFVRVKDFSISKGYLPHVYFWDTYRYMRYFNGKNKFSFLFGDVTKIPQLPQIVKSRPVDGNNANSIVLNLNKVRHFVFVDDPVKYEDKKDLLIGRGGVYQKHRVKFYQMYFEYPMCDLGHVGHAGPKSRQQKWKKAKMTIEEHLGYKFILCLEGNDVASNLKWVMSSNSIAVMPKPKFETWFMEGRLKGDYHYIEIRDDYSDLPKKLKYYLKHPEEAQAIINHAHEFVAQFKDQDKEELCSLLVLKKYFDMQRVEASTQS